MSGRLRSTIASSVSSVAARIGSAAFLLPPGRTDPSSRRPPSTMKRSMGIAWIVFWILDFGFWIRQISISSRPIIQNPKSKIQNDATCYPLSMLVAPLGSGSAGNAYYFESDGTSILIDAGLGPRETRRRLEQVGRDIERLRAIVVTHEHYDHI